MDSPTTPPRYVHGYSEYEARRLGDQANTLAELLHADTAYPAGSRVLEVGCGVGAQTVHLVAASPAAHLVAVDVSGDSLAQARTRVTAQAPGANVHWLRADLFDLPFADAEFDHLFVRFVLEHLPDPERALAGLRRVLRPGGTITSDGYPCSPCTVTALGCTGTMRFPCRCRKSATPYAAREGLSPRPMTAYVWHLASTLRIVSGWPHDSVFTS